MKPVLSFSLFLFLFAHNLWPADLAGQIEAPDGRRIADARILIQARDGHFRAQIRSDAAGDFRVEGLAPGEYLVEVRAEGFIPDLEVISVGDSTDPTTFRLEVQGLAESVIVTASRRPQSLAETSKAVDVITAEELRSRNDIGLGSAIRNLAGVRVQQHGSPLSFTSVRIRGLRNQDTALLIDGGRFRDASSLDGDATSFFEEFVLLGSEKVEVLKGSGSSLHGTNAIGGAINLLSLSSTEGGQLLVEGGGLGIARGLVTYSGSTGDGRFSYATGVTHVNQTDGIDGNDAARRTSALFSGQYQVTPRLSIFGHAFVGDGFSLLNDSPFPTRVDAGPGVSIKAEPLSRSQRRALERGEEVDFGEATFVPDLDDPDNRRSSRFFSGLTRLTFKLARNLGTSVSYHFVGTSRRFEDGPAGVRFEPVGPTSSELDGRIHTLRVQGDWAVTPFNFLSVGYEFEDEESRSRDLADGFDTRGKTSERSHSFFFENQTDLFDDRLQLTVSGRAQKFSLAEPDFNGTAGPFSSLQRFESPPTALTADGSLSYWLPGSSTKLRAHVGNSYRAPSLFNRFGSTFFFGFPSYFGDPRLRPERSISADFGIDQHLDSERIQLSATYFYTRLQETIIFDFSGVIEPNTDPFARFGGYRNGEGGLSRGVEVSGRFHPRPDLEFALSYTYTDAAEEGLGFGGFDRTLGVSRHEFTSWLIYRLRPGFDLSFDLDWVGDYFVSFFGVDRPFRLDGPAIADLGISYRVPINNDSDVRFHITIDNLFDNLYFENGFEGAGRTARAGMRYYF